MMGEITHSLWCCAIFDRKRCCTPLVTDSPADDSAVVDSAVVGAPAVDNQAVDTPIVDTLAVDTPAVDTLAADSWMVDCSRAVPLVVVAAGLDPVLQINEIPTSLN